MMTPTISGNMNIANKNVAQCGSSTSTRHSVRFSRTSSLIRIEPASQDTRNRNDAMRQQENLLRDIRAARTILAANPPNQNLTDDQIPMVLGLEIFLSPGVARQRLHVRRQQLNLILDQQARLQEDDLCALSMASSRLTCEKAHVSAEAYWETSSDAEFN